MDDVKQEMSLDLTHNVPMPEVFRELCEALGINGDNMTFVYSTELNMLQIQMHTELYF